MRIESFFHLSNGPFYEVGDYAILLGKPAPTERVCEPLEHHDII